MAIPANAEFVAKVKEKLLAERQAMRAELEEGRAAMRAELEAEIWAEARGRLKEKLQAERETMRAELEREERDQQDLAGMRAELDALMAEGGASDAAFGSFLAGLSRPEAGQVKAQVLLSQERWASTISSMERKRTEALQNCAHDAIRGMKTLADYATGKVGYMQEFPAGGFDGVARQTSHAIIRLMRAAMDLQHDEHSERVRKVSFAAVEAARICFKHRANMQQAHFDDLNGAMNELAHEVRALLLCSKSEHIVVHAQDAAAGATARAPPTLPPESEYGSYKNDDSSSEEESDIQPVQAAGAGLPAAALAPVDTRAVCKYGMSCYRSNPDHYRQFRHPPGHQKGDEYDAVHFAPANAVDVNSPAPFQQAQPRFAPQQQQQASSGNVGSVLSPAAEIYSSSSQVRDEAPKLIQAQAELPDAMNVVAPKRDALGDDEDGGKPSQTKSAVSGPEVQSAEPRKTVVERSSVAALPGSPGNAKSSMIVGDHKDESDTLSPDVTLRPKSSREDRLYEQSFGSLLEMDQLRARSDSLVRSRDKLGPKASETAVHFLSYFLHARTTTMFDFRRCFDFSGGGEPLFSNVALSRAVKCQELVFSDGGDEVKYGDKRKHQESFINFVSGNEKLKPGHLHPSMLIARFKNEPDVRAREVMLGALSCALSNVELIVCSCEAALIPDRNQIHLRQAVGVTLVNTSRAIMLSALVYEKCHPSSPPPLSDATSGVIGEMLRRSLEKVVMQSKTGKPDKLIFPSSFTLRGVQRRVVNSTSMIRVLTGQLVDALSHLALEEHGLENDEIVALIMYVATIVLQICDELSALLDLVATARHISIMQRKGHSAHRGAMLTKVSTFEWHLTEENSDEIGSLATSGEFLWDECPPWQLESIEKQISDTKRGSLNEVVTYATSHSVDNKFLQTFVATHAAFVTPQKLFSKLVERFRGPPNRIGAARQGVAIEIETEKAHGSLGKAASIAKKVSRKSLLNLSGSHSKKPEKSKFSSHGEVPKEQNQSLIQLQVAIFMKHWIERSYMTFSDDLVAQIGLFLSTELAQTHKDLAESILRKLHRVLQPEHDLKCLLVSRAMTWQ